MKLRLDMLSTLVDFGCETPEQTEEIIKIIQNTFYQYGKKILIVKDNEILTYKKDKIIIPTITQNFIRTIEVNFHFSNKKVMQFVPLIIETNTIKDYRVSRDILATSDKAYIRDNILYHKRGFKRVYKPLSNLTKAFMTHYPLKALIGAIVSYHISPSQKPYLFQLLPFGYGKDIIIEALCSSGIAYDTSFTNTNVKKLYHLDNYEAFEASICQAELGYTITKREVLKHKSDILLERPFSFSVRVPLGLRVILGSEHTKATITDREVLYSTTIQDYRDLLPLEAKQWFKYINNDKSILLNALIEDMPSLTTMVLEEIIRANKKESDYLDEMDKFFSTLKTQQQEEIRRYNSTLGYAIGNTQYIEQVKTMQKIIYNTLFYANKEALRAIGIKDNTIYIIGKDIFIRRPRPTITALLFHVLPNQEAREYIKLYDHLRDNTAITVNYMKRAKKFQGKVLKGILLKEPQ